MDEEVDSDFNHHIAAPFPCPPKSLLPAASTTVFSNSTWSDDDGTKKTLVEDKVVADSNSEINIEIKSLDHDSSFLNDRSVVPMPSLEVFNHMPTMQKSRSLNQKPTMTVSLPLSKGKNQTFQSAQQHSKPSNLQLLSEEKIKPLSSNTIHVSAQSISLNLNRLQCFDPGGMISLLLIPCTSIFISVQFQSRVSLSIPPEPPDWVVVQASSLKLPLCVTAKGIATTLYLDIHSCPILLIVPQVFAQMPMCQVVVGNATISRCTSNRLVVVEFELSKELNSMHRVHAFDLFRPYFHDYFVKGCVGSIPIDNGFVSMSGRHIKNLKWSLEVLIRVLNYQIMNITKPLLDGICIEVPKVLAHEPQLVHPWSYLSDLFHAGCSSVLAKIQCYFGGRARVRIFNFISKAGGNEIASQLSFMKLYKYPIDNSYELNMISHAIRNFTFEFSGIKHFVHRRKSKSIGKACSHQVEVGVWTLSIPLDNIIHNHPGVFYMMEGIYTNTVFIEFTEKEWIFLVNSSIFAFMLWNLLALLHKLIGFSAIKVIGAMFVLFINLEFHSLTRQELNLKNVLQYHREYFIFVAMFEIQRCFRIGNLVLKMISNSINGNVFKPTSEVYFVVGKGYVRIMCIFKVDYVAVDKLVASTLVYLLYSWQVMNQLSSLQQLPFLNICYYHAPEFSLTSGKNRIVVYSPHVWKFDSTTLYVISYPLTKESLMFLHPVVLMGVLHSFHGPKILTKLKDWSPKNDTWKFAANVDFVVAILHRKMIERGSVHVPLILLKWKTLPPKHGSCDRSSLRTRMFEGESIVIGFK